MKGNLKFKMVLIGLSLLSVFAFKTTGDNQVKGWVLAGDHPEAYEIGIQQSAERNGKVAYLKSTRQIKGFGTIMQEFIPEDYLGKRIRLTGYIKSKGVEGWSGMWFRVDGEKRNVLAFDNMQDRPIKGTTPWKKYEIILDVPQGSKAIAYGVLLSGEGTVWVDDLSFQIVSKNIPETKIILSTKPRNTDFESSQH